MADSRTHGTKLNPNPATEVGVTADMAWEWGTFTVTDKSGATVDNGKYLSVFVRRDGGWVILRDMWNSDAPMQAGK